MYLGSHKMLVGAAALLKVLFRVLVKGKEKVNAEKVYNDLRHNVFY